MRRSRRCGTGGFRDRCREVVPALTQASAKELLAGFRDRTISPVEALEAAVARIAAVDPLVGAVWAQDLVAARTQARRAEAIYRERPDEAGLLEGVPLLVKDMLDTAGLTTTYGSSIFAQHVPSADADAVARVRQAGAIVLGKAATHEFACGSTSDNPHFGPVRNPWDLKRVAGGSSGGSAAALAADEVPLALGSDTAGSIRIPAAYCGVVGLKPTYGRVSTDGLFPLARSLDHVGAMARTPYDTGLLLAAIARTDLRDPAGQERSGGEFVAGIDRGVEGLRIGLIAAYPDRPVDDELATALQYAAAALRDQGATVVTVALDEAAAAADLYREVQGPEAVFAHRAAGIYPDRLVDYGPDVRGRLERGALIGVDCYLGAQEHRRRLRTAFELRLASVDLLLTPAVAHGPGAVGTRTVAHAGVSQDVGGLATWYTTPQTLTGLPAGVVRVGFDDAGLPLAVQLTGRGWEEALVLRGLQTLFDADPAVQARRPSLERP